jgi:hypothetical protein
MLEADAGSMAGREEGRGHMAHADVVDGSTDGGLALYRLDDFLAAPMYTRAEVLSAPCPVPREPGVYGWWFARVPDGIDAEACVLRDGSRLLYVGISPRRPPANGRPPSQRSLRHRIKYHYTGNAEGSTLRRTLGCLLSDELGIELRRVGSGKRMTFVEGEPTLSAWMSDNARVSWIVDPAPWLLEERFIGHLDVPLNIEGNNHNRFHAELVAVRAAAAARARALPVVPNPRVGGRWPAAVADVRPFARYVDASSAVPVGRLGDGLDSLRGVPFGSTSKGSSHVRATIEKRDSDAIQDGIDLVVGALAGVQAATDATFVQFDTAAPRTPIAVAG